LRDLFGLTEAEAALAQAVHSGPTITDYARTRRLSLNTIYTHLRRLREKTGSSRLPELIHKLNEVRLPLRAE
jgi:DNA-binding CsgD family transcriptional regulator